MIWTKRSTLASLDRFSVTSTVYVGAGEGGRGVGASSTCGMSGVSDLEELASVRSISESCVVDMLSDSVVAGSGLVSVDTSWSEPESLEISVSSLRGISGAKRPYPTDEVVVDPLKLSLEGESEDGYLGTPRAAPVAKS